MTQAILFGVISVLGLITALGTVLARNLVHAALMLVAFFFLVACQFLLLEAEFLAAVQVLVYIGAVAILLMFGIMLTRNILGDDTTTVPKSTRRLSMLIALGVFAVLALGIATQQQGPPGRKPWKELTERPAVGPDDLDRKTPKAQIVNDMAKFVGRDLLTRYVIAFEVAGILLTAALVGAIVIAHQERDDDPATRVLESEAAAADDAAAADAESSRTLLTSSSTR
ncbi:MAG: NADH-quinone oxidoreductase subunit J [Isosphaeraceae bacterium]|nr:NADH-quinone oxidoreductase subunit J [Isosphaeraceae bacterium]